MLGSLLIFQDPRFNMAKSILITGCSSGIGLAAAQQLQQFGYRVFASCRKPKDLTKLQAIGVDTLLLDVSDSASIKSAINYVLEQTNGTLDAIFNNAGYAQAGAIEDLNRDLLRQQFETNVFGQIELIQRVIPIMRAQGYGRIIQNSSILGIFALPYRGAYNASKFAIEGFIDTLRLELANTKIKVSLIEPGPIATHFRENAYTVFKDSLQPVHSLHQQTYQAMVKHFFQRPGEVPFALAPESVVKKLLHALESPKPKSRYFVGFSAYLLALLKRCAPTALQDNLALMISRSEIKSKLH